MRAGQSSKCASEAFFAALLLFLASPCLSAGKTARGSAAQTSQPGEECLACHGEKSLTTARAGKTVSLFVDAKKFSASIHGGLGCTGCHADLAGKDLPHETPLAKVNCGTCHPSEMEQHARSLHGKAIARFARERRRGWRRDRGGSDWLVRCRRSGCGRCGYR